MNKQSEDMRPRPTEVTQQLNVEGQLMKEERLLQLEAVRNYSSNVNSSLASLSSQLAEVVAHLKRADDVKKGEGGSSSNRKVKISSERVDQLRVGGPDQNYVYQLRVCQKVYGDACQLKESRTVYSIATKLRMMQISLEHQLSVQATFKLCFDTTILGQEPESLENIFDVLTLVPVWNCTTVEPRKQRKASEAILFIPRPNLVARQLNGNLLAEAPLCPAGLPVAPTMGNTVPKTQSRKKKYEVKPQYEEHNKNLNHIRQCNITIVQCMKGLPRIIDYGSLRQSGPRPDPRLLRQAALEALTRSARTDSPRRTGRKQFFRRRRRRRRRRRGRGEEGAASKPKNLKFQNRSKPAPTSCTGPKTSRAARDRPEPNPRRNQTSRHDIAGAAAGRRPPHEDCVRQRPHALRIKRDVGRAPSRSVASSAKHGRATGARRPANERQQRAIQREAIVRRAAVQVSTMARGSREGRRKGGQPSARGGHQRSRKASLGSALPAAELRNGLRTSSPQAAQRARSWHGHRAAARALSRAVNGPPRAAVAWSKFRDFDALNSEIQRFTPIRSTTRSETPSSGCTRSADEISTNGFSSSNWPETVFPAKTAAAAAGARGGGEEEERRGRLARIQLAVGPQPLWLRNQNSGLAQRIMVKRLATSPHDPLVVRTNQYNQDLGLIHSTNGNHLESPNEGSSIDHQVTIYLHAQNITMFPTDETWYFTSQILVSNSGGLILILTSQSTRNTFRIHSDY
ncbi:crooked neck-like protein 1 [Dorcoceras hygrometricum]|uniref:Crooked neck-like protein 1 n=1 Tax=Dorcoceras hygrometricum TaxID=472368 RepID=A0A2Z7CSP6_9LAMI|nr:crooked neck-like protein 1 [Dorcoceras hygrometricum]